MGAAGVWLYEKTGTGTGDGGGGTPDIPAAPKAVVGTVTVKDNYDGKVEIKVNYTVPGSTVDNYRATAVYLEDPDLSAQQNAPMDGTALLDGSKQLSGTWNPTYELDSTKSPAVLLIKASPIARKIRVYLATYGPAANATLRRATLSNPTPSVQINVPASAGAYVSGQEYAFFALNPSVTVIDHFENPTEPTYQLKFNYDAPPPRTLPPGMQEFGGVQIIYEYPDLRRAQGPFLDVNKPDTWITGEHPAAGGGSFIVYFASVDVSSRVNSVIGSTYWDDGIVPIASLTPAVLVTILPPTPIPPVTGLALTNARHQWQPDGTIFALADLAWTPPASVRYSGTVFYRTGVVPPVEMARAGNLITKLTLQVIDFPRVAENWTITAISYDAKGKLADNPSAPNPAISPSVVWNIGPPTNAAPLGSGGAATIEQELGSDGVVRMKQTFTWANPAANDFGGMSIARIVSGDALNTATWYDAPGPTDTKLVTAWEPAPSGRTFDYYFVSRTPQGVRNAIQPGTTPKFTLAYVPMAGNIIPTRMPAGWWSEAEFSWPSYPNNDGSFIVDQIVSGKIFVGSLLRVGGGTGTAASSFAGNQNGQIAVYNAANVLRGWIGQQDATATPDNPTAHSIFGAWFAELYVGGSGPPTAPLYARQDGAVIIGGIAAGSPYPYISIRRDNGVEVGRIGAKIGEGLVSAGDPAYIGGAWFNEFAIGGTNLADWRILSRRDTTGLPTETDLVTIRNVNKFSIHWAQNAASADFPSTVFNEQYDLSLGLDVFGADANSGSYYKFPGMKIVRTGTNHKSALINRGLILDSPAVNRIGALVTYNNNDNGQDGGTYWCSLTMRSPVSTQINVRLESGGLGVGHAYLSTRDASNNLIFEAGYGTAVVAAFGLRVTPFTVIDASGNVTAASYSVNGIGSVIDASAYANFARYSHRTYGIVIDTTGAFVGKGVLCPSDNIGGKVFATWVGTYPSGGYAFGVSGSFVAGAKTVTVTNGLITSIV